MTGAAKFEGTNLVCIWLEGNSTLSAGVDGKCEVKVWWGLLKGKKGIYLLLLFGGIGL
jgi:hypothetical protein